MRPTGAWCSPPPVRIRRRLPPRGGRPGSGTDETRRSDAHRNNALIRWDRPEVYGIACKRTEVRERKSPFNSRRSFHDTLRELMTFLGERAGGVWLLQTVDDALGNAGRVDAMEPRSTRAPAKRKAPFHREAIQLKTLIADGIATLKVRAEKIMFPRLDWPLVNMWWPQTRKPKAAIAIDERAMKL